jgi:hypothetical protein
MPSLWSRVTGALDHAAGSTDEAVGRAVDSAASGDVAGVLDASAGGLDEGVGNLTPSGMGEAWVLAAGGGLVDPRTGESAAADMQDADAGETPWNDVDDHGPGDTIDSGVFASVLGGGQDATEGAWNYATPNPEQVENVWNSATPSLPGPMSWVLDNITIVLAVVVFLALTEGSTAAAINAADGGTDAN